MTREEYNKRRQRAIPDDFASAALRMSKEGLAKHYRCNRNTVNRWLSESGATIEGRRTKKITAPDNLTEMYQTMTMREISAHLGIGRGTVARMIHEAGINKPKPEPKAKSSPSSFKPSLGAMGRPAPTPERYHRDMSVAGQAADWMRRFGPVFRDGDIWRRGNARLTDAELIERAEWKGFKAVAGW